MAYIDCNIQYLGFRIEILRMGYRFDIAICSCMSEQFPEQHIVGLERIVGMVMEWSPSILF